MSGDISNRPIVHRSEIRRHAAIRWPCAILSSSTHSWYGRVRHMTAIAEDPSSSPDGGDLALKRMASEYDVARLGLIGLLTGVILGLSIIAAIVLLAMLLPLWSTRDTIQILTGAQLVQIVMGLLVTIAVTSLVYGVFV